jgi:hypothetical protein
MMLTLGLVSLSKSLFHVYFVLCLFYFFSIDYIRILASKACLLCFNELCHDYLLVKTCFSVYQVSIVKIVIYDYCGGCFLTIGNKVGFM